MLCRTPNGCFPFMENKMTVFEDISTKEVKYHDKAPWKKRGGVCPVESSSCFKGEASKYEKRGGDALPETWKGAAEKESQEGFGKIRVYSLISMPLSIVGWIAVYVGISLALSVIEMFRHPLVNDSIWQTILTGIGIGIVGFIFLVISENLNSKKNDLFKKHIVRHVLENYFTVRFLEWDETTESEIEPASENDSVGALEDKSEETSDENAEETSEENSEETSKENSKRPLAETLDMLPDKDYLKFVLFHKDIGITKLVSELPIRHGHWNKMSFNDLFVVEQQGVPLLFCDIELILENKEDNEKSARKFMGQVLVMPIRIPCKRLLSYKDNYDFQSSNEEEEIQPLSWIKQGSQELETLIQRFFKDDVCEKKHDEEALRKDVWGKKYDSVFEDVRSIAGCDIGVVVSGPYMVLILENNFDPFEFTFKDNFRTSKGKTKQVEQQITWIYQIFRTLRDGGVI